MPLIALNTVGPTLMRYGTQVQKARFLPRILAGDIDFAIGYTEPEAGTDLASLRTHAVREGDEYVINGTKISQGPDAGREVAIAKFWAAEGGQRVVSTAQHLHGGMGADIDYPLHRYTLWSKWVELAFGGATQQLVVLGELIAR